MTGYQSKKKAALDEEGMYLVHHTKRKDYQGEEHMSIEAMKQALEALEVATTPLAKDRQEVLRAQAALRQAIEQAEKQEPVAWMREDGQRVTTASDRHNYPDYETRYSIPLYTHPPQRTWVGLTEEERRELFFEFPANLIDAIEAKLKEKNT